MKYFSLILTVLLISLPLGASAEQSTQYDVGILGILPDKDVRNSPETECFLYADGLLTECLDAGPFNDEEWDMDCIRDFDENLDDCRCKQGLQTCGEGPFLEPEPEPEPEPPITPVPDGNFPQPEILPEPDPMFSPRR